MIKEIKEIGDRGVIFQYEDQNLVYLIKGDKRLYLCDTHLGSDSMDYIKKYIKEKSLTEKELVIFNSHSDFDHNWGNFVFDNSLIIGHELNLERFKLRGEYDLEMKNDFKNGKVELVYPNLTFENKLSFKDDEIEFIYLPGHTIDSAVCFDKEDSTVYVGDLVEKPIPMVLWENIETFIESLEYLKKMSVKKYVASHSGLVNENDIKANIDYLKKLKNCEEQTFKHEGINRIHKFNVKNILMKQFEKRAKNKLKDEFNFKEFKIDFWKELGVDFSELENEFNYLLDTDQEKLKYAFKAYLKNN